MRSPGSKALIPGIATPVLPARAWRHLPREAWIAPLLAASAALPTDASLLVALAAVLLLGVPHGALDGEIARTALRPRWGRWWFLVFSLPYLSLSAGVLLAWRWVPLTTLAAFLALSVLHFGVEESRTGQRLDRLVRGGLPVAAPVLLQPGATAHLLSAVSGVAMPELPGWLWAGSLIWLIGAGLWLVRERPPYSVAAMPALLVATYAVLPPITAFALYFICVHAPAHIAGVVQDTRRAPRVQNRGEADLRSVPLTVMTLAIGAALWWGYSGPWPDRLLALTIQGLAALTLPHMLLDAWTMRRLRPLAS